MRDLVNLGFIIYIKNLKISKGSSSFNIEIDKMKILVTF